MAVRKVSPKGRIFYIYVIECAGSHKVGISNDPTCRMADLQVGNPVPLRLVEVFPVPAPMAEKIEGAIHDALAGFHVRGEWFNARAATVLSAVDMQISRAGLPKLSLEDLARKMAAAYVAANSGGPAVRQIVARARMDDVMALATEASAR